MNFKFNNSSLYNKLLFWFLLVGFFPFFIFYVYAIYWTEEKVIAKITKEQYAQAQKVVETIENHLVALNNELFFLSKIDVMDDLIADDIDKRITRVLLQKKEDINLNLNFCVIDMKAKIIASSDMKNISHEFLHTQELQRAFLNSKHYFFIGKKLYMYNKIFASFASEKELGVLILEYDLENLKIFFPEEVGANSTIYNANKNIFIGMKLPSQITLGKMQQDYILDKYLVTINAMPYIMKEWYFVYYIDKKVALSFLYDFLYFMLAMVPVVFILVLIIGIFSAKSIVKPIKYLTKSAEEITQSKDYTRTLTIESNDEIGRLSYAFNELLKETNSALENLKRENKIRLKRFIELIETFNAIMQTKSEIECISVSIEKMKSLTTNKELHFSKVSINSEESIPIFITDFRDGKKMHYGYIVVDIESINDLNEYNFYNAIASMISLQLDRILLINQTMSASDAKSSFISNMSHELRTPLNSIISSTQYLLSYESLSDDQQDTVANVENSAQYLLEMINGILDIAKIEAGKMDVNYSEFNLSLVMNEIVSMFTPLAEQKDLELQIIYDELEDENIKTDMKLFKQIVINLLSNAIKFTSKGYVKIYIKRADELIELCVRDSGIGIDKESLNRLFSDFTQIRTSIHKEYAGTGLGLSLSKKLANLMDGDVTLESDGVGKGCEVTLILKNQS